jgi:putative tricarboxylic transport membrane protein
MGGFTRRGDFWSGLAFAALAAYILASARGWTYMGEEGPGPGFFPLWYGGIMLALSLALVAGSVLGKPRPLEATRWRDLGRALACWLAFVACIALMPVAGFPVAFALLTWFIVAVMARRPQRVALALAVGGALLFYLLFEVALGLSLPRGLLY